MKLTEDEKYMSMALRLAKKAEGMTSPNPMVGAVLVDAGEIIGKGYHRKAGLPHAEIEAFTDAENAGRPVRGATLYVSLEPCCHEGKRTPPCTNAVVDRGISRVVVGCLDQNPKVSGDGVRILEENGIAVTTGVLEERAKRLNESFFKHVSTGRPFIILKLAATLDGRIASYTGDSKWIGSEEQRKRAHKLRASVDAVLVGIGTALMDNPSLNARLPGREVSQPTPVVMDSRLRIPLDSKLLKVHEHPIIATSVRTEAAKAAKLEQMGAQTLFIGEDENGLLNWNELTAELGRRDIMSVLIEGGSEVAASALKSRIVDKVVFFYAPKIVGGDGIGMVGAMNISSIKDSLNLRDVKVSKFGDEFMVEGYL